MNFIDTAEMYPVEPRTENLSSAEVMLPVKVLEKIETVHRTYPDPAP